MNRSIFILSLLLAGQAFSAFGQKTHLVNPAWDGSKPAATQARSACNNAGTFKLGAKIAKSNDIDVDTMYLCANDSVFLDHNGDYDLSGDPIPGTPGGIIYGLYKCKPTVSGDNLAAVLADPCAWLNPTNNLIAVSGQPNGDMWLYNDGITMQGLLNDGRPVAGYLAAATIDYFGTLSYEQTSPTFPPGPCVNVNAAKAMYVAMLTPVKAGSVQLNNGGNDCLVRFIPTGGLPQLISSATYKVDITLKSNPAVKGLVLTPEKQIKHGARLVFSAPQPGQYLVTLKDGKSCDYQFTIDVPDCNPSDNVVFSFPKANTAAGNTICVPLKVKNFSAVSASFSIQWDPKVLKYKEIKQVHPAIQNAFDPAASINDDEVSRGALGALLLSTSSTDLLNVPNDEALFDICFEAVGANGSCTPIVVNNSVTLINVERTDGPLAPSVVAGEICVGSSAVGDLKVVEYALLSPNPAKIGQAATLQVKSRQAVQARLLVVDATGRLLSNRSVELSSGDNTLQVDTRALAAGVYQLVLQTETGAQSWRLAVGQ